MKKKIYISGGITGNKNAQSDFEGAEFFLRAKGFNVVNPMKLDHSNATKWEDYMKLDIAELMKCDAIYLLNSWQTSRGATIEHNLALSIGITVFFEQYKFKLDELK